MMKAQTHHAGGSEVTALLQQIECEYAAARNGLSGLAQGASRHAWITARMEWVAAGEKRLATVVGSAQAIEMGPARLPALGAQTDKKGEALIQQNWTNQEQDEPFLAGGKESG